MPTAVEKNSSFKYSATLNTAYYEVTDVTFTMNGASVPIEISGDTYTFNIAEVTGPLVINFVTKNTVISGNVSSGNTSYPSTTTDITSNFSWTNSLAIIASTGTTSSSSFFKASSMIDISDAKTLTFTFVKYTSASNGAASFGYAFYDSSKTYISGKTIPKYNSTGPSGTPDIITIDIPSGACYFRTTYFMQESLTTSTMSLTVDNYEEFSCKKTT
jgi:hypothetical protein